MKKNREQRKHDHLSISLISFNIFKFMLQICIHDLKFKQQNTEQKQTKKFSFIQFAFCCFFLRDNFIVLKIKNKN